MKIIVGFHYLILLLFHSEIHSSSMNLLFSGLSCTSCKGNTRMLKASIHKHYLLILKHCCKQMEFVFAYRLRRCLQIMLLYSKWCEENKFKLFINSIKKQIPHRNKFLLSSCIVSCLNNEKSNSQVDFSLIKDTEFSR